MEVKPEGAYNIYLKKFQDHFQILKCNSIVRNLVMGTTYVYQTGDMVSKNTKTGDTCTINFKDKGWTSTDDFVVTGTVSDAQGNLKYKLDGHWNKDLWATNANTGEKTLIVEVLPRVPQYDWMYNFTDIDIQLNYLNKDILEKVIFQYLKKLVCTN